MTDHLRTLRVDDDRLWPRALVWRGADAILRILTKDVRYPGALAKARETAEELRRRREVGLAAPWGDLIGLLEARDKARAIAIVERLRSESEADYHACRDAFTATPRASRAKPQDEQGHKPGDPNCRCQRCRKFKAGATEPRAADASDDDLDSAETAEAKEATKDAPLVGVRIRDDSGWRETEKVFREWKRTGNGRTLVWLYDEKAHKVIKVHDSRIVR